MKTIHVGGLNPFNRVTTLEKAFEKAKDDDTIVLHKNDSIAYELNKNVIIEGNGHALTVKKGTAGIIAKAPIEINNVVFKVETRSNALVIESSAYLTQVKTELLGPIREFYPVILNKGSLKAIDSNFIKLQSLENTSTDLDNCKLESYYGPNVSLSTTDDMSKLDGHVNALDSYFGSTLFTGSATLKNAILGQYNMIHHEDTEHEETILIDPLFERLDLKDKTLKKEPKNGPLKNKIDNNHHLYIRNSRVRINGYDVTDTENLKNHYGIVANNSILTLENIELSNNQINHSIENSAITFSDSHDANYWVLSNATPAFIRSTVNTNMSIKTAKDKLNELVGLTQVKEQFETIMNTITVNRNSDNKNFAFSNNFIFAGDPGTGKTTVADIFAEALFEVGAIRENKVTKATVDNLIKGYVGQTADNVRKILDQALGGVLFIDEAYELAVKDNQNSFNSEALSVIIRYMEDHRDELVVIAAGYEKEMRDFLASNVGLARRFQWISFEDYDSTEMAQIFELIRNSYGDEYEVAKNQYLIQPLFEKLILLNTSIPDAKGRITNGGNGGLVRNVYQRILEHRNNRLVMGGTNAITESDIKEGFRKEMIAAKNRQIKN